MPNFPLNIRFYDDSQSSDLLMIKRNSANNSRNVSKQIRFRQQKETKKKEIAAHKHSAVSFKLLLLVISWRRENTNRKFVPTLSGLIEFYCGAKFSVLLLSSLDKAWTRKIQLKSPDKRFDFFLGQFAFCTQPRRRNCNIMHV